MHENSHEFSKEQETIQAEEQPKSSNLIGWANTSFFLLLLSLFPAYWFCLIHNDTLYFFLSQGHKTC